MTPAEPGQDVSTTGRHIPALDGLRGLAILLVLADHLLWSNPNGSSRIATLLLSLHAAGWIGVDLFFVLSGFLITGILYDSLPSPHFFRNFYARRALRIFPLYYGFLFVVIGAAWLTGHHWNVSTFRLLTYTQNITLRAVAPFTNTWWVNVNHLWSLAIEEQFYLAWPLLLFLLRKPGNIALAAVLGALASLGLRLLLWHSSYAAANPYLLYIWTPARLDGLFAGALLAVGIRSATYPALFRASRPVLLGATLALCALYLRYPGLHIPDDPAVMVIAPTLLSVLFAALLLQTLLPRTRTHRLCSTASMRFFGRYSYGIYLFHPAIGAFTLVPTRFWLRSHHIPRLLAVSGSSLLTLALTVGAAWCSFHFFESPILRLKSRFPNSSPRPRLDQIVTDETSNVLVSS